MSDDIELGPIDYLVVEWPAETPPNGKAFPLLVDLVDRGLIRVLDLAFIQKQADGTIVGMNLDDLDLDGNPELAVFEGAASGLLGYDDLEEVGTAVEPGAAAAILLRTRGRAVRDRASARWSPARRIGPRAGERPPRDARRRRGVRRRRMTREERSRCQD
jgi:hypothetical protein